MMSPVTVPSAAREIFHTRPSRRFQCGSLA
jgi:hypothetical protein